MQGAYAGPSHSMRWENDHPLYKDSIFINKPASCIPSDDYEPSDPLGSTYHFYTGPGTETTTGTACNAWSSTQRAFIVGMMAS